MSGPRRRWAGRSRCSRRRHDHHQCRHRRLSVALSEDELEARRKAGPARAETIYATRRAVEIRPARRSRVARGGNSPRRQDGEACLRRSLTAGAGPGVPRPGLPPAPFWPPAALASAPGRPDRGDGDRNAIAITGPAGYCVDPTATRDTGDTGFVLLGNCAAIANSRRAAQPATPAVLTAAVSPLGRGPLADSLDELDAFFRSDDGRRLISRSGEAATVTVSGYGAGGRGVLPARRRHQCRHHRRRAGGLLARLSDVGSRIATLRSSPSRIAPSAARKALPRCAASFSRYRPRTRARRRKIRRWSPTVGAAPRHRAQGRGPLFDMRCFGEYGIE